MIVAVSVDMEGVSQLRGVRERWGCLPEYWETGKPRVEADVRAVCDGLLAGGASEVVVLDNHGGNTVNVSPEALPPGARLETWRDFDLRSHAVDATFQVGYHPRGGVDGFLSHTLVPGLRFRDSATRRAKANGTRPVSDRSRTPVSRRSGLEGYSTERGVPRVDRAVEAALPLDLDIAARVDPTDHAAVARP
jgi:hypothetical protein